MAAWLAAVQEFNSDSKSNSNFVFNSNSLSDCNLHCCHLNSPVTHKSILTFCQLPQGVKHRTFLSSCSHSTVAGAEMAALSANQSVQFSNIMPVKWKSLIPHHHHYCLFLYWVSCSIIQGPNRSFWCQRLALSKPVLIGAVEAAKATSAHLSVLGVIEPLPDPEPQSHHTCMSPDLLSSAKTQSKVQLLTSISQKDS